MTDRLMLRIELDAGPDADADETDDGTRALTGELAELDVDAIDRPAATVPDGARAAEVFTLGTLLVTLGPQALGSLLQTVRGWIGRRAERRVTLELDGDRIELTGASDEDERRLVDAFLARHR